MLLVKTFLKESLGRGIGLFADQRITVGTVVWKYHRLFNKVYSLTEVDNMSAIQQNIIFTYACLVKDKWILSIDNTRFINHSYTPNIKPLTEKRDVFYASKHIPMGVEIFSDYRDSCDSIRSLKKVKFEVV